MPALSSALNSSIDLSAVNLGKFSLLALFSALLTLLVCLIAVRLIVTLIRKVLEKTPLDSILQRYVLRALRFVLWIIAILISAEQLGIPVTSLVAFLSVLSLAISLAVQNVLSNIAGGLVILITKPFQPGDYVETPDGNGYVTDIHLSYTHLDTLDGLRISVPNSNLAAGKIVNHTSRGTLRVEHIVTASYDAPISTVRQACLDAVGKTANVLPDPAPAVYVSAYGESSISYTVRCWCAAADYWDTYYALLEEIKLSFDAADVEMTYNHLNVHIVSAQESEEQA